MRLSPSPNPSFARSFLSTVTLLALGQSALAYEFTPPHTNPPLSQSIFLKTPL